MASYRYRSDIIIENLEEDPIVLVEVQSRLNLSRDEAIEIHRDVLDRGVVPSHIPCFLLLAPDIGFLWKSPEAENPDALPTYEFPMDSVMGRFANTSPEQILVKSVLELVFLQWLLNLSTKPQEVTEEPEKTLPLAGFTEAVKRTYPFIRDYV